MQLKKLRLRGAEPLVQSIAALLVGIPLSCVEATVLLDQGRSCQAVTLPTPALTLAVCKMGIIHAHPPPPPPQFSE